MDLNGIPKPAPDLIWRVLEDGVVVVTPSSGNVRVLNKVGTAIWELIDGKNTVADIESHLVRQYEVTQEQAASDLHSFLTELTDRGLLVWETP